MSRRLALIMALLVGVMIPAMGVLAQQGHAGPPPSVGFGRSGFGPAGFSRGGLRQSGLGGAYPTSVMGPAHRTNSLGADWHLQQEEARFGVRHGQLAPLGTVIQGIQKRAPGRQLDTGIEYDAGKPVYRVRWMTAHGRRVDFLVDAASGAIMGEK